MKLFKIKKAKLNTGVINTAILAIVLLVVLFQIYANILPEAQAAGSEMNDTNICEASGCYFNDSLTTDLKCVTGAGATALCTGITTIPLSGLFSATGIIFIIIMASLLILVVKSFMKSGK